MKVGVIGTGTMGKNHVRIYSELKEVKDVCAFDVDTENIKRLKEYGVIVCDSEEELLERVDAVSICVPTRYHLEVAKRAIEKDVHCLIEKPIASTVEEGEELVELLENKDLIAGVGHIERFNPIISEIEKIIKKPLYVEIRRHNPASSRITDSTVVEDLMVHDIDIVFNVLFDGAYEIYSAGNNDLCTALIKFDSSIVSLSASRKASKKIRSVYIEEEEFTIEGDFMNQEIYVYRKPGKYGIENERYTQENIIEKVLVNKVEPLKEELKTFVRCVEKGEEFTITPLQAFNNLRICEEIRRLNGIL
ncbi:MAG: UDP-N-acetylglucosamine 3-dehydrogenase [Candidatus Argoarchaeum ethanivorans]|uniref:UDP-N-acetylglucosamine 3-dehydrogenase n=1 Tax=Candidatus Argoarchaeum ethanivorans TaxID=2608793 RepID=A0A811TJB1_9EURY|nr:MAG: UDP-N-acetylglucosamine 3-dehydrogenase [Candidatus Argoarchaeum ethanivorans]